MLCKKCYCRGGLQTAPNMVFYWDGSQAGRGDPSLKIVGQVPRSAPDDVAGFCAGVLE